MAAKQGVLLSLKQWKPFYGYGRKAMVYVKDVHQAYSGVYPDIGKPEKCISLYMT